MLTLSIVAPTAKGGPGSGFHGHAGRPGEVGGSAPDESSSGAAGDLAARLEKDGRPVRVVRGQVVVQATRFASKDKWAVWNHDGMVGNWHDTPEAAVDAWDQAQTTIKEEQRLAAFRSAALEKAKAGKATLADWHMIVGNGKNISISGATSVLRECGLSLKEAKRLANSLGIVGESGGGAQYINSEALFEKLKKAISG